MQLLGACVRCPDDLWFGAPAVEETERLLGGACRLDRVSNDRETGVSREFQRLAGEFEIADDRVAEDLGGGAVQFHVVCGPPGAELGAASRQFADEVSEAAVVGIATGFAAQRSDAVACDSGPIGVEVAGAIVQEEITGKVERSAVAEGVSEKGPAHAVAGEDVVAP